MKRSVLKMTTYATCFKRAVFLQRPYEDANTNGSDRRNYRDHCVSFWKLQTEVFRQRRGQRTDWVRPRHCYTAHGYRRNVISFDRLPPPQLPNFSVIGDMIGDGFAIAIVGFAISVSLSKLYGMRYGYSVEPNQVRPCILIARKRYRCD